MGDFLLYLILVYLENWKLLSTDVHELKKTLVSNVYNSAFCLLSTLLFAVSCYFDLWQLVYRQGSIRFGFIVLC